MKPVKEKIEFADKFAAFARMGILHYRKKPMCLAYHSTVELQFIKRGKGAYFVEGERCPFSGGTLIVIHPNEIHCQMVEENEEVEKATIFFDLSIFGRQKKNANTLKNLSRIIHFSDREATDFEMLVRSMMYEREEKGEFWKDFIKADIEKMLLIAKRASLNPYSEPEKHPVVSWVVEHIEKNFRNPLSLPYLAEKAGYSPNYLSMLFKQKSGMGIKQYILQRRILESKRILLEQLNITVEAVAEKVGFADFSLFNRSFKKLTGKTPTEFRKISHLDDKN